MKLEHAYHHDEHCVHLINYHLVWCPHRRRPVLVGAIATRCRELLEAKCQEQGWAVLALAIQPDHLHLFVCVNPSNCASEVVKACKGITAFRLRREFPALLRLPSMWTRSFFASTAGNVSQQTIQRYIDAQTGR